jgi:RNA polymerase sigma factor (sigma-70 family)
MVCRNCPLRNSCETPCDLLINALEEQENQGPEVLLTPYQFDQFVDRISMQNYQWASLEAEEVEGEEAPSTQILNALYQSFDLLTPRQLQCLMFYYWRNLSYSQISRELGITRQTVTQHLEAAHQIIRDYYQTQTLRTTCRSAHMNEGTPSDLSCA